MNDWPDWSSWELELTDHVLDRMIDRNFNEADLRLMLEDAKHIQENHEEGRWVVETVHLGRQWAVIVEPLWTQSLLLVVTAYPIE